MSKEFVYVASAQLHDGSEFVLDLEEKGWADKEILKKTKLWSLVPKEQNGMPVVTVSIPDGAQPIFKTRVFTRVSVGGDVLASFRAYCIGYKLNGTHYLLWVMPNGNIEVGEDPHYADLILKKMAGQL